jgi:hypothetical protein
MGSSKYFFILTVVSSSTMWKHEVIGAAITAELEGEDYILLLKRSDKTPYWPGYWYFLTEHAQVGEHPIETLSRGLHEETRLEMKALNGKAWLRKMDPVHSEIFDGYLYHVTTKLLPPILNEENAGYAWHELSMPFHENPSIADGRFIDGIVDDMMKLKLISVAKSREYKVS